MNRMEWNRMEWNCRQRLDQTAWAIPARKQRTLKHSCASGFCRLLQAAGIGLAGILAGVFTQIQTEMQAAEPVAAQVKAVPAPTATKSSPLPTATPVAASHSQPASDRAKDQAAIRAAAAAYIAAVKRGDAKAIAALWTDDGDIVDEQGMVTKGRDTAALIAKNPADVEQPTIRLKETSLRFLSDSVAIEDGSVELTLPGLSAVTQGRFTATWVKQGNSWQIASLRETKIDRDGGPAGLADLEWMVGDWTVVDNLLPDDKKADAPAVPANKTLETPRMEVSVRWNATHTFLLRDLKFLQGTATVSHISQRIGWDPLARNIHSWMFATDGAYGEGFWKKDGDAWIAQTTSVMQDGSQMSALTIYVYDQKDRCTWRSFHTHVGGEHLPQVNMTMIRKPRSDLK